MLRRPRRRSVPRIVAAAGTAASVALLATGCGTGGFAGVYNLPLPGGADLGGHPYRVVADFTDVLDLVPQAAVKVNDVPVGRVEKVDLPAGGWTARVTMLINGDVHLPANAEAHLEQSSLLGEKYVQLVAPADASGTLGAGDEIPVSRTNRNTEVEEVLGALSLLLNGGGIGQVNTITKQLNAALDGNEPQVRSLLTQIQQLTENLDAHRGDITAALDALNRLAANLAARDQAIGGVLDNLAPGLKVLDEQRDDLVTMLQSVDRLSTVAVNVVNQSRDDFVADLDALQPILRQLANAGQALPQSLQVLLTYPFTDQVLNGIKGDYLNVYLSVTAAAGTTIIAPLAPDTDPATGTGGGGAASPTVRGGATPSGSASPSGAASPSGSPPPLPLPAVIPTTVSPSASGSGAPSASPSDSGAPSASSPAAPPASPSDDPTQAASADATPAPGSSGGEG